MPTVPRTTSPSTLSRATRPTVSGWTVPQRLSNTVLSNRIGTDASGTLAVGNGINGVLVTGGDANYIQNNIIARSGNNGIWLIDTTSSEVSGNWIGMTSGGAAGNAASGVRMSDNASGNSITGNVISGNGFHTEWICMPAPTETTSLPMLLAWLPMVPRQCPMDCLGIYLGSSHNIVGGETASSRNSDFGEQMGWGSL
jgi:hypothetical protein